jgi:hypothetical protein
VQFESSRHAWQRPTVDAVANIFLCCCWSRHARRESRRRGAGRRSSLYS